MAGWTLPAWLLARLALAQRWAGLAAQGLLLGLLPGTSLAFSQRRWWGSLLLLIACCCRCCRSTHSHLHVGLEYDGALCAPAHCGPHH